MIINKDELKADSIENLVNHLDVERERAIKLLDDETIEKMMDYMYSTQDIFLEELLEGKV